MINFMAKEDSVARKNGKYLLLFVFCFLVAALQAKSPGLWAGQNVYGIAEKCNFERSYFLCGKE